MLNIFLWLAYVVVGSTIYVYVAFLSLCTAKRIEAAGIDMPWDMRAVAALLLLLGVPADVLYNATRGVMTFREWRGWTFSAHIQDRIDRGLWDPKTVGWARLLNVGDPNHIKGVPE